MEEFCHKREQRNEVGVEEGCGIKRVFLKMDNDSIFDSKENNPSEKEDRSDV